MEQSVNHFDQGIAAYKAGDIDTAIAELEAASQEQHDNYKVFNYLGAAYAAKGRYEKAIGAFKIAADLAPGMANIHYNIGQAYEAVGVYTEAEYEYEKALSADPNYSRAENALMSLRNRMTNPPSPAEE